MSWAWLNGTPVLLFLFVVAVIGLVASVIAIVQSVSPTVRKIVRSRAGRLAIKPATVLLADPASINPTNLNPCCREHRPSRAVYAAAYKRVVEERRRQRRAG